MKNFPALPEGWTLRDGFLTNEIDESNRYVLDANRRIDREKVALILENYGYGREALHWQLGHEAMTLLRRARAYVKEVGGLGAPGSGVDFVPNLNDPQTKLAIEIDEFLAR